MSRASASRRRAVARDHVTAPANERAPLNPTNHSASDKHALALSKEAAILEVESGYTTLCLDKKFRTQRKIRMECEGSSWCVCYQDYWEPAGVVMECEGLPPPPPEATFSAPRQSMLMVCRSRMQRWELRWVKFTSNSPKFVKHDSTREEC